MMTKTPTGDGAMESMLLHFCFSAASLCKCQWQWRYCYPLLCTLPACLSYLLLFLTWMQPRRLRTQSKIMYFSSVYKKKLVNLALFAAGWFQIPIVSVWYFVYDFTWKILLLINIKRAQRMYCTHADLRPHYIIRYERIGPCTSTNATHLSYTEAKKMRKAIKFATFETIAIKWNHQAPTRFTTWKFTRRWFLRANKQTNKQERREKKII